jgi:hypothetical protein
VQHFEETVKMAERTIVKDFKDGPFFHYADPDDTNRAMCGASTVNVGVSQPPKWGTVNPLVKESYCRECEKLASGKKKAAPSRRKAAKKKGRG